MTPNGLFNWSMSHFQLGHSLLSAICMCDPGYLALSHLIILLLTAGVPKLKMRFHILEEISSGQFSI